MADSFWQTSGRLLALLLLAAFSCAGALGQSIRLRNEVIDPASASQRQAMTAHLQAAAPLSGLFLVQLTTPPDAVRRAELRAAGVDLVKYVPDNAFVARLSQVAPATLAGIPFLRWFGPYQPSYKIHPRLAALALAATNNQDLAVSILLTPRAAAAEIQAVRLLLSAVHADSHLRQGTILRGLLPPKQLETLAASSAVLWIENAPKRKLVDEAASKLVGGDDGRVATPTLTQQMGFTGTNVIVCVADTGLDSGNTNTMHPDLRGRVSGFRYYGALTDGSDGYGHGTHCAGIVAGNAATGETDTNTGAFYGLGVASAATLFIERIFDSDANEVSPFPSDETLTTDAVRHGAKVASNSWGSDVQGDYDTDAAQFDELVRDADPGTPGDQPYILEFSAGNAGPASQTLDSPATGKNVIATGASENQAGTLAMTYGLYADGPDTMADFSSRGPCADGRIKPDLVAPGTWIASAASAAAPNEASIAWSPIDNFYVYMGGTSMSGPHAAGAAAVFVQFYQSTHNNATPSPALVKAALINSADELDQANGGPGPVPNNDEGWGRINLANIVVSNVNTAPRFYQFLDQTVPLTNGQVYSQHVFVQSTNEPLKVTLAYTDVPGFPGAQAALVNDLDLEVVAPDGTLYRGNQFGAGESVPNAPTPDQINNVEGVLLSQPAPGDYLIRVRGSHIVQDALTNTPAIDQDFALVCSADLIRPGTGSILLDRSSYTAPSTMRIEVFDATRALSNSVSVVVSNLTAQRSVSAVLLAAGGYGAFTGLVATVTGTAGAGQIQIANGDLLEADYVDSGGVRRRASAVGDLAPPTISAVSAGSDVGVLTITWQTTQPASSIVVYGTNRANLNLGVTNLALVTSHEIKLTHLVVGATYYYMVLSADAAGNVGSNNNGGADFSFIGIATPTVLLVDAYDTAAESSNGSTVIPDSAYTNVLASAGISFGFWKVIDRGSPQLADLQPFPVVIWRLTDDEVNYGVDSYGLPDPSATNNTLSAGQQFMIQSYLNGGGSFFMSSMGVLSQLGDVPFRRNVLQVAGFIQNPDPPAPCSDCDEDFGVPSFLGAPAGLADGAYVTLDYSNYPSFDLGLGEVYGPDFSDTFTPSAAARAVTFESASGKPCGMSYPNFGVDSPGRIVFFSFPFDAIPTNGPASSSASSLLQNIVAFLAPGANGKAVVLLDNTAYTTNDLVTVELGDSALAGSGQAQVSFSASSRTNVVTVTVFEMTHPGLFKGTLNLVAGPAGTNQLQVQNRDTLTATYFDAAAGHNATATATIDTVPPVISQVTAASDYYDARVTWLTSKPADSSVQYGESALPDRSAYVAALVTNHTVTLSGLTANRVYYYQVVSRDQAGNTTIDDNNGVMYTFQTQRAPTPPWFDNLETGASGWSVVPDPVNGSDQNWALGTPNNGLATSAYSGTNAWGSDLDGNQNFTLASSYLYAPVIDLTGFQSATLTFRDVYDFSRVDPTFGLYYEDGIIYVSTNSSTPPGNLPLVEDFAGAAAPTWQQETVDLTPFVGQTIQVVFYYEGVPVGDTMYGWTIDDIGITGVAAGGTINIRKNLGQGTWSLSSLSPLGLVPLQSGIATSASISNAPGQYVVQFSAVPFYITPPGLTNTLAAGATLNFNGNYTFLDANHNGISDAWELYYFGEVSTNRTMTTDTDQNGMSDYAKFIAGINPTNPASVFGFTSEKSLGTRAVQLQWPVVADRLYQLSTSSNLVSWSPLTGWLQPTNNQTMTYAVTNATTAPWFYRLQVQP
jgi:hypothetical protein